VLGPYIQNCRIAPLREMLARLSRVLVQVERQQRAAGGGSEALQVQVRRAATAAAGPAGDCLEGQPGARAVQRLLRAPTCAARLPLLPQELMGSSGAGVACILAASRPELYLPPAELQREQLQQLQRKWGQDEGKLQREVLARYLPSRELEFDMRGRMEVSPKHSAAIDVGECKSSADYAGAV
jgi:hypothetical protein